MAAPDQMVVGDNRFRCWWTITERAVWPFGVIEHAPLFDQYLRLAQSIEDFPVEQLIAELAVERLAVAVLPGTAWRDADRFVPSRASQ